MLAVKAKYENGTVRWERTPPVKGLHDLIVVFADVPASDQDEQGILPSVVRDIGDERQAWTDLALANLEAAYSDDEPEYYDAMLKTPNTEFAP